MTDDDSNSASVTRLDHFVKIKTGAGTGGQAKLMIQNGEVKVNGAIETRRRRKLVPGDVVEAGGQQFRVDDAPHAE